MDALPIAVEGRGNRIQQVYDQLRRALLDGRIGGGARLPSTRALAARLGVARNTVTEAYDRLTGEGFLRSRVGSGTYAVPRLVGSPRGYRSAAARRVKALWHAIHIPDPPRTTEPLQYSFLLGVPDHSQFPFALWRRIAARAWRNFAREAGTPTTVRAGAPASAAGLFPTVFSPTLPALQAAIASHVAFTRAVGCDPQSIIATTGAQQALDLIGRVLVEPGDVVAVEEPGYPPARAVFQSYGARIAHVAVDAEGLAVDRLPARAKLVYVTPSHQFPLGVPLSLRRRLALLAWARRHNAIIVEDDYDGEFRYAGRPLDSLQSMDRDGLVVYVGTFSKVMFPALRMGFLIPPPALHAPLSKAKRLSDWGSGTLDQAALAAFISAGLLARHVRRMRRIYARRRDLLLSALARDFAPWLEPLPAVAGLHLTAMLKKPLDLQTLIRRAGQQGVGLESLERFYAKQAPPPGLVFGYGATPERDLVQGLARLRALFSGARR